MIGKKNITVEEWQKHYYSKSCTFCDFAIRPREGLPPLCTNKNAVGFSLPWEMPLINCEYFNKRKVYSTG